MQHTVGARMVGAGGLLTGSMMTMRQHGWLVASRGLADRLSAATCLSLPDELVLCHANAVEDVAQGSAGTVINC